MLQILQIIIVLSSLILGIILKKIAKQGKNRVIIIPTNLHQFLNEGELVKIQISRIREVK